MLPRNPKLLPYFPNHPPPLSKSAVTVHLGRQLNAGLVHQLIEGGGVALNQLVEQRAFWALVVGLARTSREAERYYFFRGAI